MTDDNFSDSPNSLEWLAFRYVSDELPAALAEEFERKLEFDQAAREAVARSVALCEAVSAACECDLDAKDLDAKEADAMEVEPMEAAAAPALAPRSQRRSRPLAWMALGAAASLAAVMVWRAWSPEAGSPEAGSPEAGEGAQRLANAARQAPQTTSQAVSKTMSQGVNLRANPAGGETTQSVTPAAVGRDLAMMWLTSEVPSGESDPLIAELTWPSLDETEPASESGAQQTFDPTFDSETETLPEVKVPSWLMSAVAPEGAMGDSNPGDN